MIQFTLSFAADFYFKRQTFLKYFFSQEILKYESLSFCDSESFYIDVSILIFVAKNLFKDILNTLEMFPDDHKNRCDSSECTDPRLISGFFVLCSIHWMHLCRKVPEDFLRLPRGYIQWSQKQNNLLTQEKNKTSFQ